MRIRTIRPEFFKHDSLAALPAISRILFIGLWCMADRRGRLEDRPRRIKAEVLPYDEIDADAALDALSRAGFIIRYKSPSDGLPLIQIPAFERHQRIGGKESEVESNYPAPTCESDSAEKNRGSNCEAPVKHSGSNCEALGSAGKERKGRERKEGDFDPNFSQVFPAALNTDAFKAAWNAYMDYRRESKFKTLKSTSVRAKFEEMATWGERAAIAAINDTIRNGWQGIFPPKSTTGRPSPSTSVPNDLLNAF